MAGPVPAIHVLARGPKDVDTRHKAGHDVRRGGASLTERPQALLSASVERPSQTVVMAGLVPAIHVLARGPKDVDTRHKAGHDVRRRRCVTYGRSACPSQRKHGTALSTGRHGRACPGHPRPSPTRARTWIPA